MNKFWSYLSTHPAVKNVLNALVHVLLGAIVTYVGMCLGPAHTQQFAWAGLGIAVLGAWKSFIQNNNDLLLAFLQDQLQALGGSTSTAAPIINSVPAPKSTALSPIIKTLLFGFLIISLLGLATPGFCSWDLPTKSFGIVYNPNVMRLGSPTGTLDGDLIPTASIGYGVGGGTPSYGLSLGYDFVVGNVVTVDSTHVTDSPIVGVGGAFYFDAGPWLNSNMQTPVLASGGFNLIGPELEGIVPGVEQTWNFQTGEKVTQLILSSPFTLLESIIIPVFGN